MAQPVLLTLPPKDPREVLFHRLENAPQDHAEALLATYDILQGLHDKGLLEIAKGAHGSRSKVVCDALLLDEHSRSDTYPTIRISEDDVNVGHEATVSKVGDEQMFYLQSHGISEEEAGKLIVNGFIEPIVKELPMEYAVEMNRLIELQMEGSIG